MSKRFGTALAAWCMASGGLAGTTAEVGRVTVVFAEDGGTVDPVPSRPTQLNEGMAGQIRGTARLFRLTRDVDAPQEGCGSVARAVRATGADVTVEALFHRDFADVPNAVPLSKTDEVPYRVAAWVDAPGRAADASFGIFRNELKMPAITFR